MTQATTEDARDFDRYPYRIVDSKNQGWLGNGDGRYWGFDTRTSRRLDERPLADVEREFGRWRPVVGVPEGDADELEAAFTLAGRKLITSLASALEQVHFEARERFGPWDSNTNETAAYAERTLTAGRPGSWESACVAPIVWFGNELNLWPRVKDATVAEMRATGPNTKRVHVEARDRIAAVLRGWVASDERYVEVAEHLAARVSWFADERHGAVGWSKIADQWLQPGGLAQDNFRRCYTLLYSVSSHMDPALL